jgi:phosphatidylglycerophosphate synthase
MPSVYNLKPKLQYLPRPVTNGRARADLTANPVRIAAMVLSVGAALYYLRTPSTLLIVLIVLLAASSEMTGIIAALIGASRRYDGPMGKNDRALVFGALGLLLGLGAPIASAVVYMLWMVLALLCTTIVNRSRSALAELRSRTCS